MIIVVIYQLVIYHRMENITDYIPENKKQRLAFHSAEDNQPVHSNYDDKSPEYRLITAS